MAILVLDLARVLDESHDGKAAAGALAERWDAAKTQHAALKGAVDAARGDAINAASKALITFEQSTLASIEDDRRQRRERLLEKVRPLVAAVAKKRRAEVVLEASSALFVDEKSDITQEILAALK